MNNLLFLLILPLLSFTVGEQNRSPYEPTFPPEIIFVKGGSFDMGCAKNSPGYYSDERLHPQTLSDFYIGKYLVTIADFARFVEETDYLTEAERKGVLIRNEKDMWQKVSGVSWRCDVRGNQRPISEHHYPVTHVTWNDAKAYCAWLSEKTGDHYDLPSEAQWEYAARSRGKAVLYSWGSQATDGKSEGNVADETGKTQMKHLIIKAGYDDGFAFTSPVGTYPPNELGVYDMTGNVWEWCEDMYQQEYPSAPPKDYRCLEGKDLRVVRGGSWFDRLRYCRVTKRNFNYPDLSAGHYGFRVAMRAETRE